MKRIIFFCLMTVVFSFAEYCRIEGGGRVDFLDTTIWYMGDRTYFFPSVVPLELVYTLEDGYACHRYYGNSNREHTERSYLDSNVYLYRVFPNQLYIFTSTKATHTIGEVFRDEFLHWQQCEKLSLTYEEADSLIVPLVEEMDRVDDELCDRKCDSIYDISKFYYERGPWTPFTYPKTILTWIEESCETEPIRGLAENSASGLLFVGRDVVVPKDLQGEKYILFDMNGKALESGFAGARIRLPAHPSILMLGGQTHYRAIRASE